MLLLGPSQPGPPPGAFMAQQASFPAQLLLQDTWASSVLGTERTSVLAGGQSGLFCPALPAKLLTLLLRNHL